MSYGFRVRNPGQEVVVDNRSLGPVYVGRGSYVGGGGYDTSGIVRRWRPYRYQITMPSAGWPPMVAVAAQDGVVSFVDQIFLVSGNTWEVRVYSASYGSYQAFNEPVAPEVFIFAPPGASPAGSFGIALRNGGALRWDLSQRPLWIRQIAGLSATNNGSGGSSGFTDTAFGLIGGLVKPAIFMTAGGYWDAINYSTERYVQGSHGWCRSGSTVYRRPVLTYHEPGTDGASALPFPSYTLSQTFAVIIDAANLP